MCENKQAPPPTRRTFQERAIYVLAGLLNGALGIPALAYIFVPAKGGQTEEWLEAGAISGLPDGRPTEVSFKRTRVDGWRVTNETATAWVIRQGNSITAFTALCTHLGCAYHWDHEVEKFECPCHTSFFSKDGSVETGPAPRALDRYETKVENGTLFFGTVVEGESV